MTATLAGTAKMPNPDRSPVSVYLHIGLHRSGSTTIQKFLHANQNVLRERGYLYPVAGRGPLKTNELMPGHHNLAWQLGSARRFSDRYGTWDDLLAEIETSGARNVVLSAEDLDSLTEESINRLATYLDGYSVRVIVYLRRQDLAIQSAYSGSVKRGAVFNDFENFIDRAIETLPRLGYDSLLSPWKSAFGLSNLIVRPFETDQLQGNLCQDFLRCIGIDEASEQGFEWGVNENVSPSLKTLEAAKLAKKVLLLIQASPARHHKCLKALREFAGRRGWNDEKLRLVSKQSYAKIHEEYAESNAAVARGYLSRDDGILFFEDYNDESGLSRFNVEDFSDQELSDIFAFVLKHRG